MASPAEPAAPADSASRQRTRILVGGGFALAFAVGMAVRLTNLRAQILLGDELHAVRAALSQTLAQCLTTYRVSDNCIPLTALYRALMDSGVRLDETVLRAPVLLFGALFLAVAPVLVARRFGASTGLLFAGLAAVSPLLVFYSRLVRSYMPAVALSFVAALAFLRWLDEGGKRWAAAYVLLGALAVWFHLLTGPIVVLPLAVAAARALRGRPRDGRRLRALVAVGAALAAALLLFLVPAAASLRDVVARKVGETGLPGSERWHAVFLLFAGTASMPLALTFWLLAALGVLVLWRTERHHALFATVLVVGHVLALFVLRPFALDSSAVFARYLLPTLPWVLVAVARGLVALVAAAGSAGARRLAGVAAAAVLAALAVGGPLGDPLLRRSSFLHSATFLLFPCARPEPPADRIPAIYRTIAALPGRAPIVEAPGDPTTAPSALRAYQEIHRRRVQNSAERLLQDKRLNLRNTVSVRPLPLLRGRASWVLVHRDLSAEGETMASARCFGIRLTRPPAESRPDRPEPERLSSDAGRLERLLRATWGEPDSDADGIAAWNLDRLRSARQKPAGEPERPPAPARHKPGERARP